MIEEALRQQPSACPSSSRCATRSSFYGLASGGLGFAVPGAVGISLALPGRPVAAMVGDGSAMYGIQGLWTAAHEKLPITYVIANNRGYRIIKERLVAMRKTDKFTGMDIREPDIDFVALAKSFGLSARRVTDPPDIAPALREGYSSDKPNLVDIRVRTGSVLSFFTRPQAMCRKKSGSDAVPLRVLTPIFFRRPPDGGEPRLLLARQPRRPVVMLQLREARVDQVAPPGFVAQVRAVAAAVPALLVVRRAGSS